jgi:hypothetical protein
MNDCPAVTYTLEWDNRRHVSSRGSSASLAVAPVPRIARLLALAIRLEGLIREQAIRDRTEVARRGCVTRARMTQIMKMLLLAPDIQEQILFLPPTGLTERKLRAVVDEIDWTEQRRMFQQLIGGSPIPPITPPRSQRPESQRCSFP